MFVDKDWSYMFTKHGVGQCLLHPCWNGVRLFPVCLCMCGATGLEEGKRTEGSKPGRLDGGRPGERKSNVPSTEILFTVAGLRWEEEGDAAEIVSALYLGDRLSPCKRSWPVWDPWPNDPQGILHTWVNRMQSCCWFYVVMFLPPSCLSFMVGAK